MSISCAQVVKDPEKFPQTKMQQPKLSILIPAIPSRFEKAIALYNKINLMCQDKDIEVLMLTDNKKRTIGAKRQALKNASIGIYFMFVDDDDDLLSVDEIYKLASSDLEVDVITFKQRCRNNDGSEFIVDFSLLNKEVENNHDGNGRYLDMKRPPFHVCAWNQKFKKYSYPDVSYGEDWGWIKKVLPHASSEYHIDKVVHSYNFDPKVTEASTESNAIWTNPNGNENLPVAPAEERAICNIITPIPRYIDGQQRLINSLMQLETEFGDDFDVFTDIGEDSVGAPPHDDNPYAFKVYAIRKLRDKGYKQVFWFDASIVAVKSLNPLWERLSKTGVFMEEAGHWVGTWCNEYTLKYFNLTREEAMKIPMFAAGYIGIDFRTTVGQEFFAHWNEAMLNGCFRGSWQDHRHDMTCASIIAHKLGITHHYGRGGEFFAYIGDVYGPPSDTAVCHLLGL